MEGTKWDALFHGFSNRLDAQRRREEEERSLTAWYDEQTKLVMLLVREVAQERAQAFERSAGQHIEVTWPSRPPINVVPEGPFMSFMSVAMGEREVQLYSHRLHAAPPAIHYAVVGGKRAISERKRLMSYAGCRIERRVNGGFVLVAAAEGSERRELSADDVAFRAFELLLASE
jgi:hypothetical protein